eukprot:TRINITY_DN97528_c0_g1_i1.p1 TRINITY_DN97528_c0_g1~~TRINITY_DN97528_c0_g1_i1.p1  ORF type:complete len:170 (-),score=16.59 TRINITY_DN97528_c0_g1_i1:188-655(-)
MASIVSGRIIRPTPRVISIRHTRQSNISASRRRPLQVSADAAVLQFIRGVNENTVPDVRLTKSRDGSGGTATFIFQNPTVFENTGEMGDITGLYMVDDEGTLQTVQVQAKFVNGKPDRIECRYIMRSVFEWDRFMRFMERYAESNQLGFTKSPSQ